MLHTGIAALDTRTGELDSYDFGGFVNTGEPVFAADPEAYPRNPRLTFEKAGLFA
jgi:hypothetical protein